MVKKCRVLLSCIGAYRLLLYRNFIWYVWLYWFIRVGRLIELLVIRGLSEVGFVVFVMAEILDRLCSDMVGVGQAVWKRTKNGGDC